MRGNDFGKTGQQANSQAAGGGSLSDGIPAHSLMAGLEGAIPAFGGRDVTVGFYGDQAFCSDQFSYVNLPALPPTLVVPNQIAKEIRGFAMHEASHLIWTDFDFMENGRSDDEKQDRLLHSIWNALEDYMIERNCIEVFAGVHKNFTATEIRCAGEYLFNAYKQNPDVSKDLRSVGTAALTWARSIHFGLQTTLSRDCMRTLPASLQQRVWGWFNDAIDVESTQECWELAKQIVADIRANPYDPADPPANPNQLPGMPGAPGQGGQGGQGGAGGGSGGSGSGQAALGAFNGTPTHAKNPQTGQAEPTPIVSTHALDQALKELGDLEDAQKNNIRSFVKTSTITKGPAQEALTDTDGHVHYQQARRNCSTEINMISRSLSRALQTLTKARYKGGRSDGRLDTRRLTRVRFCDNAIYKRMQERPQLDTAVSILIDNSGSMSGERLEICQQIAVACNQAFGGTPIKTEMLGYTSGSEDGLEDHEAKMVEAIKASGMDINVNTIELYEFKPFDGNQMDYAAAIGNAAHVGGGGTPTAEAILAAAERLRARFDKERRHVLFVLTDGQPNDPAECKKAVELVEKMGVTVVGFGIQSTAVKTCFSDWVHISDLKDLAANVMTRLSEILFRDVRKRGRGSFSLPAHVVQNKPEAA